MDAEFIEGRSSVKLLWASCPRCGDGVEVQYVPARDAGLDVGDVTTLTYREAETKRQEWEDAHRGACKGSHRLLAAV